MSVTHVSQPPHTSVEDYDGDSGSVLGQTIQKYRDRTERPHKVAATLTAKWATRREDDKKLLNGYNSK
jgi:hypothetical protein